MPDEDKNFGGSLVLDFRKWWRHVKTIYISKMVYWSWWLTFLGYWPDSFYALKHFGCIYQDWILKSKKKNFAFPYLTDYLGGRNPI